MSVFASPCERGLAQDFFECKRPRLGRAAGGIYGPPEAILYHKEKASRGDSSNFSSAQVYRKERSYFVNKWANMIRDDPFFHPALSLISKELEAAELA